MQPDEPSSIAAELDAESDFGPLTPRRFFDAGDGYTLEELWTPPVQDDPEHWSCHLCGRSWFGRRAPCPWCGRPNGIRRAFHSNCTRPLCRACDLCVWLEDLPTHLGTEDHLRAAGLLR